MLVSGPGALGEAFFFPFPLFFGVGVDAAQHLENTCHARSPPRAFESTAQAMYINYRLQKHAPYPARAICRSNVGKPLDNALCFYFQTLRRLVDERVHRFRLVLRQGDVAKSRRHGTQLKLLESGEIFILFGALVDGFRL